MWQGGPGDIPNDSAICVRSAAGWPRCQLHWVKKFLCFSTRKSSFLEGVEGLTRQVPRLGSYTTTTIGETGSLRGAGLPWAPLGSRGPLGPP